MDLPGPSVKVINMLTSLRICIACEGSRILATRVILNDVHAMLQRYICDMSPISHGGSLSGDMS